MIGRHPFYYEKDVLAFAKVVHRHPGIVIGQMQFRMKNYAYLTKKIASIRQFVLPEAIVDGSGAERSGSSNLTIDLLKLRRNNSLHARLRRPCRSYAPADRRAPDAAGVPAGEIAARFDVSPPAISQHLKVLREAGLVSVRADAQRRIYGIDPSGFAELDRWLARVKLFGSPSSMPLNLS